MLSLLAGAVMLVADTNHFAVCPKLPPTSDTATMTVYGKVWDPFTRFTLPAGFAGIVAEAVRARMTIPESLPIVVFDARGRPIIVATAAFSLMMDGTVKNVVMTASSSSPIIDSLLTKGIEGAQKDSSYPVLPPGAGSGIRLALAISPDSATGAVPMFSIRVPWWRDFAAARPPQSKADTIDALVIIDEQGVPLLGTIQAEHMLAVSQLGWFRDAHFVPGHIQRCAVRSLLHLPISVRR